MLSPAKFAVIECTPTANAEVVNVAWPVPSSGPVPSVVPVHVPPAALPSQNVTLPAGCSKFELTVAVNVTDWLNVELVPVEAPTDVLQVGHLSSKIKLQPLAKLPKSPPAPSKTYKFQVPLGSRPPKIDVNVSIPNGAGFPYPFCGAGTGNVRLK